jgi:hypothetical protein
VNTNQVRFLLALIANIQGLPLDHFPLPTKRLGDDERIFLMSLDGGPKIYVTRRNRQTFTVSAHGYAFHGRDAVACYYLIGLASAMGERRAPSSLLPEWWEKVKAETTRLASGMVPS